MPSNGLHRSPELGEVYAEFVDRVLPLADVEIGGFLDSGGDLLDPDEQTKQGRKERGRTARSCSARRSIVP